MRFQEFFSRTRHRFFNFLLRMTGSTERAEEIFQESYTRYWERYGQELPNVKLLFAIGRNAAVDGHRRRNRERPLDDTRCDGGPDQEAALIAKESCRRMLDALQMLDPAERQLLSLAADGGLRYEEIARISGISIANVKVRIHRARQKLRRSLQEM